jgi:hypothetical protein
MTIGSAITVIACTNIVAPKDVLGKGDLGESDEKDIYANRYRR